ncbi:MAG: DNA polymerase III subunit delta [Lachnospiraceae bacterium]|nr:DNA polymerase III subunit delta [Lachnospiraceae bacterium]
MQRIRDDIKNNNLKQIYLLFGEETYLRRQYRDMLKDAVVGDDSMNLSVFRGPEVDVSELIDQARTLPFFAERRLILVEDSGFFKDGEEHLERFLKEELPESTYLVFSEEKADRRKNLFKLAGSKGVAAECGRQDEETLTKWVAVLLKKAGKKMSVQDLSFFLSLTGNDMNNIKNETDKLISYTEDRPVVTAADVKRLTTRQLSLRVFDLIDTMGAGKTDLALAMLRDLFSLKESAFGILSLIARQFRLMIRTGELMEQGYRNKYEIGKELNIPHYVAGRYMTRQQQYGRKRLIGALEACAEADWAIKTGRMEDTLALELLITEYSTPEAAIR